MNNDNNNNNIKNKISLKWLIIPIVIVAIFVAFTWSSKSGANATYKIAREISQYFVVSKYKKTFKDNVYEYSYISKVNAEQSVAYEFSVAKYNSEYEARQKINFNTKRYELAHEKIDNSVLAESDDKWDYFIYEDYMIFNEGIYVVSLNSKYKDRFEELKGQIINIIKKFNTNDLNKPDTAIVDAYWNNKLSDVDKEIDKLHNDFVAKLNNDINDTIKKMETCEGNECKEYLEAFSKYEKYPEMAEQLSLLHKKYDIVNMNKEEVAAIINNLISAYENNLDINMYEEIKDKINTLGDDEFYSEYKISWEKRLNAVEERIYKNNCTTYNYKDVLRYPDTYRGKNAYWFGVVQQKVSNTQYRVGVDCTKYHYIDGYSCDNTIYVEYYGSTKILEKDVLDMWGAMKGTITYTDVIGRNHTIPLFNAKYIFIR